ncbi:MAG TPA: hypothetical protein VL993_01785 [Stellaceae bacterium]|nr:hypothetical protein [Stellaceae bacterium]
MAPEAEPTPLPERATDAAEPNLAAGSVQPRRKFLTHGVAGASAAVAVSGVPVKTLAKAYCKFSGWQSVKGIKTGKGKGKGKVKLSKKSKGKGITLSSAPKTCSVKIQAPKYYFTKGKTKNRGGWTYTYSASVNWPHGISTSAYWSTYFSPSLPGNPTLLSVLSGSPSSVQAYVIAAYFAAVTGGSGFPLSTSYVQNLWTTYGTSDSASLLAFLQQLV